MEDNDIKKAYLEELKRREMEIYHMEKDVITEVEQCIPSKLFWLINRVAYYKAAADITNDLFRGDKMTGEHVKSSYNLLSEKVNPLIKRFETKCYCQNK